MKVKKKIRKNGVILVGLILAAAIILGGVIFRNLNGNKSPQRNISMIKVENSISNATESAFGKTINEEQRKLDEAKKKEEERVRQQEETKKYLAENGPCRYVPILMYHHVDDKPGALYVKNDFFIKQMDYLVQKGYQAVTLVDVYDSLVFGKPLPPKPVVITFDDGYRDVYLNAYPVLVQRNLKATFFVISQLLGGGDYMLWNEVQEMAKNPLMTIGDHTLSHKSLATVDKTEAENQIISARNILESRLGIKVNVFAYPYGSHSPMVEEVLKTANFVVAVNTQRGLVCAKLPYEFPRVRIGNTLPSAIGL